MWTSPSTVVTGATITASWGNTYVRDNTRYLKGLDGAVTIQDALTATGDLQGSGVLKAGSTPVTLTNAAGKLLALSSTILSDLSGANLTGLNASALGSGTVPDARFPATLPALSGVNLTNLSIANMVGHLAFANAPLAPFVNVYHNTTQGEGTLVFNSEIEDVQGMHDTSSNTDRLTCKVAGLYIIVGSLLLQIATGTIQGIRAEISHSALGVIGRNGNYFEGASVDRRLGVTAIARMAVNDYVTLAVADEQASATLTVQAGSATVPQFSALWIGD